MRTITVILLAVLGLLALPSSAEAESLGTHTEDKIYPGRYLLNGKYKFAMQTDGNLVLYGPKGVCWASNTAGLIGTYLDYDDHSINPPDVTLKNSTYGDQGHWWGSYEWAHKDGNLSLNANGEVWIAWKKWVHC